MNTHLTSQRMHKLRVQKNIAFRSQYKQMSEARALHFCYSLLHIVVSLYICATLFFLERIWGMVYGRNLLFFSFYFVLLTYLKMLAAPRLKVYWIHATICVFTYTLVLTWRANVQSFKLALMVGFIFATYYTNDLCHIFYLFF